MNKKPLRLSDVAELVAACKKRDDVRHPGSMALMEDCSGHASAEAREYDAAQARYRKALAVVEESL